MPRRSPRLAVTAAFIGLLGCSRGAELLPVSLPDLQRADPPVQAQARQRYETLTRTIATGAPDAELGQAFGEFGMLMHAAEYYGAARPAYLNAQALMPDEPRWPYYLALAYRNEGDTAQAIAHFRRVLELRPADLSTLIWLGRLYIDRGEPELAEPLLLTAHSHAPRTVAVLAALGQTALARRDYRRAVELLEEALAVDPTAQSVHSPLALAYRGLGQIDEAEAHLKQWRNTDILFPDPWRQQLDLTLESGLAYELRGVRALDQQDFTAAAELFRQGLSLTPDTSTLARSLRHKLGTALFLSGDVRGALEQFEHTVRLAPPDGLDEPSAKAHYSLGVLAASSGRVDETLQQFTAALRYNPSYVEARMGLADALRGSGRWNASLAHYEDVLRINPQAADARFGYAMALVRLRRFTDAREWLEEAVGAHPDRPELAHALARLLAAAPDPRARDGDRAFAIVEELFKTDKTTQLGETMAMAMAELGSFEEAVGVQRGVLEAARRAGMVDAVRWMERNLALYERRQPCRTPWPDDDPVHAPGPAVSPELARALAVNSL